MKYKRVDRVKELLKQEISKIILFSGQFDMKGKNLGFITVTEVEMSNDLKFARVFVSIFSSEEVKKSTIEFLNKSVGFIKGEIGKNIRLRFMPDIEFKIDNTIDYGQKIDAILEKIKNDKAK